MPRSARGNDQKNAGILPVDPATSLFRSVSGHYSDTLQAPGAADEATPHKRMQDPVDSLHGASHNVE
jgi:hypothetical protein